MVFIPPTERETPSISLGICFNLELYTVPASAPEIKVVEKVLIPAPKDVNLVAKPPIIPLNFCFVSAKFINAGIASDRIF